MAVASGVALSAACGLNPQPIPPGETDNGGADRDSGLPTNAATGGGGDSSDGSPKSDDGGFSSDDAGDASDGGNQDASDSGDT